MKIIYPYNEILPLKKAHDAYVVRNCAALASSGCDVTLLCGKGSLSKEALFEFYKIEKNNPLKVIQLPILRKNNRLRINWNYVFFWNAKRYIEKHQPDVVLFSVLKQADFLLKSKLKGCKYIYEVHQLQWYPTLKEHMHLNRIRWERSIYNRCDLVTVTTEALKKILGVYPYDLKSKLEVVPLACDFEPLPKHKPGEVLRLCYVGQLYAKQGLHRLLDALKKVSNVELQVLGGKPLQIDHYQSYCKEKGIANRVHFEGFVAPEHFKKKIQNVDAFVTTFDNSERMPYVAHTKIYEYLAMQRPIMAPNLEIVKEHAPFGLITYEPESKDSLIAAIEKLKDPDIYNSLSTELSQNKILNWKSRGLFLKKLVENDLFLKNTSC